MATSKRAGKVKSVVIEDEKNELDDLKDVLESTGGLLVKDILYRGSAENVVSRTVEDAPDVILVDFRLDKAASGHIASPSRGDTLAAMVRERLPDTPILLVSKFRKDERFKRIGQEPNTSPSVDDLLVKYDMHVDPAAALGKIVAIVEGYRALTKTAERSRDAVLQLLRAPSEAIDSLLRAEPPVSLLKGKGTGWTASEVAIWIRHTLMAYPGILYDDLTAACFLGLAVDSFKAKTVSDFFEDARYVGPFCDEADRWWKARLLKKATSFLVDASKAGPPMTFGLTWRRNRKGKVELSRCNSSGEEPADCVCCLLREPVRMEYSVFYTIDRRPAIMDEARVSFKAIKRAAAGFDPDMVGVEARPIIKEIQKSRP
jgi:CheY-like chemotaxis protein